jgi:hypothetical protein
LVSFISDTDTPIQLKMRRFIFQRGGKCNWKSEWIILHQRDVKQKKHSKFFCLESNEWDASFITFLNSRFRTRKVNLKWSLWSELFKQEQNLIVRFIESVHLIIHILISGWIWKTYFQCVHAQWWSQQYHWVIKQSDCDKFWVMIRVFSKLFNIRSDQKVEQVDELKTTLFLRRQESGIPL